MPHFARCHAILNGRPFGCSQNGKRTVPAHLVQSLLKPGLDFSRFAADVIDANNSRKVWNGMDYGNAPLAPSSMDIDMPNDFLLILLLQQRR